MKKPLFATSVKAILAVLVLSSLLPTTVFAEDAPEVDLAVPVVLEEVVPAVEPDVEPDAIILPEIEADALFVAAAMNDGAKLVEPADEPPVEEIEFTGVTKWAPIIVVDHEGFTFSHPEFLNTSRQKVAVAYSLRITPDAEGSTPTELGNYTANQEYVFKFDPQDNATYYEARLWAHYDLEDLGKRHQLGYKRVYIPASPEPTPPVTPPVTPPSTPSDDDDDDDEGIDYTAMDTTTIEDAAVPLASAPLLTILDEDVPLGNLPKTGGASTTLVRLGMSAVLLGVLICTSTATKK